MPNRPISPDDLVMLLRSAKTELVKSFVRKVLITPAFSATYQRSAVVGDWRKVIGLEKDRLVNTLVSSIDGEKSGPVGSEHEVFEGRESKPNVVSATLVLSLSELPQADSSSNKARIVSLESMLGIDSLVGKKSLVMAFNLDDSLFIYNLGR